MSKEKCARCDNAEGPLERRIEYVVVVASETRHVGRDEGLGER